MTRDDDDALTDDALTWGDEAGDTSHVAGPPGAAVGSAAAVTPDQDAGPRASSTAGSVLLVSYGVIGGVYLLYTVGWIIAVQRDAFAASTLFFDVMYQFGQFLAIASPVAWFAVAVLLTRDRRPILRVLALVVGMVVLAPWPFIVAGGAA